KQFEEFRRGSVGELATLYAETDPKGEVVLVIAGAESPKVSEAELSDAARKLRASGKRTREVMDHLVGALGAPRNLAYRIAHEGEIGVVVGRTLTRVSEADAAQGIRSIVAVNDVTARDLQKSDSQWTRAKGFDTFCPLGEESSELPDLDSLTVVARVNGVERQRGKSSEMVFSIPSLLAYISHIMTLEPGDLVATGTPSGVGPLVPGDVVEVEIPGVSRVTNPVQESR